MSSNGNGQQIPPNIEWDENEHPFIYPCSQHTSHAHFCDHKCGPRIELDSELQVELLNEGRAFARAGMSFMGIPAAYMNTIPVPGIPVEILDMLMWLETLKELIKDRLEIDELELQEKFRETKLGFLRTVREANEEVVKEQRLRQQIAIAQKPGLLGPNGEPIG